ncbi:Wzz/FepE/Etk N-terminal domain-containing protein [Candidatus Thioglobus sp.]|nr:Wzz/FepE/Etk N-terminal domain-containing protein [Candidatus Thioglobus sp.]
MKQNHHKEVYDQEEEILLKHILLFLFNSKWIILGITSLITSISIVYVMLITPIYETTVSVYPPSDLSISKINNDRFKEKGSLSDSEINYSKESIYEMFLYKVSSNSFIEQVFASNNYLEKLKLDNEVGSLYASDLAKRVKLKDSSNAQKILTTLSLKGNDPLIISSLLNDLVKSAHLETKEDIKIIEQINIQKKIDIIDAQLVFERDLINKLRLKKVNDLKKEINIAKSLNKKDANFSQINNIGNNTLKTHPSDLGILPTWYMYGEEALIHELDKVLLENENINSQTIMLEAQRNLLTSYAPAYDDIELVGIVRSVPPEGPIFPKKRLFVIVMFFISLIASLFIAYIVSAVREK